MKPGWWGRLDGLSIDVYPVGWLGSLQYAYRAHTAKGVPAGARAYARTRLRGEARLTLRLLKKHQWRLAKHLFNGYLAEPKTFPPGNYRQRCGTGWTRRRALRSLARRLP